MGWKKNKMCVTKISSSIFRDKEKGLVYMPQSSCLMRRLISEHRVISILYRFYVAHECYILSLWRSSKILKLTVSIRWIMYRFIHDCIRILAGVAKKQQNTASFLHHILPSYEPSEYLFQFSYLVLLFKRKQTTYFQKVKSLYYSKKGNRFWT